MPNDKFEFKQFTIKQNKCAMKVGTDAVLLGAWTQPRNARSILDIGTGTGILALMLAQKSNAEIDAIDLDRESVEQALENVRDSKFNQQIRVYHKSLQSFSVEVKKKYDLIVSNPPYFIDSSKAPEEHRNLARHTDELSFAELIKGVLACLNPEGRFCLILPQKESVLFKEIAEKNGLFLHSLLRIKTKKEKTEKRILFEMGLTKVDSVKEEEIIIEQDERHNYTKEYIELTKEYYLGF